MGRLIPLDADGAAQVGLSLDTLRRLAVSGSCEILEVAGRRYLLRESLGMSASAAAAELGVGHDTLLGLVRERHIKVLPVAAEGMRFAPAALSEFLGALKPLKLTPALQEELNPSVVEFIGPATEPGILDGWADGMRHAAARDEAAVRRLREEFVATLPPLSALPSNANGDEVFDPSGYRSSEETENLWQAFLHRKRLQEDAERYDRISRRLAGR
jgi:hypothetical protein